MSDVQNHNLDVSGAEEQGEGTEPDAQWDDCSESEDGSDSSSDPSPNAKDQVLTSDDILPIILRHLKDELDKLDPAIGSGASEVRKGWKGAIASLLPVNGTFFHSGANMLWHTMDSAITALELLPWYEAPYGGVGGYSYSGSEDWKRFTKYAPRIQQFKLQTKESCNIELLWLVELLTLDGRPDPLFPSLQSILFAPNACRSRILTLTILLGPSLRSLEIAAASELRGYETIPPDWCHNVTGSRLTARDLLQDNIMAAIPKLSSSSSRLQSFTYRGPTNEAFFQRLSNIKTLESLVLILTAEDRSGHVLRPLRALPNLQSLSVTALPFQMYERPPNVASLLHCRRLTSLHITAGDGQMVAMMAGISPSPVLLHDLILDFISIDDHGYFYRSIETPTQAPNNLENITVRAVAPAGQRVAIRTGDWTWNPRSIFARAESNVTSAFKKSTNFKVVKFIEMPAILWKSLSHILQGSAPHWTLVTTLTFTIQAGIGDRANSNNDIPPNTFPGLSFLASAIWRNCPKLEFLTFQFDEDKVILEDLTSALSTSYKSAASALERYPGRGHLLRELTINTGVGEGSGTLALDLPRKVQIVTFLDKLFPNLVEVRGSATSVWEEIGTWVAAYQELKDDFCAHIEAL
ncbi:hypothetical protein DFP72DRAFT_1167833 [Ephemerocybe angulata]|uniref:Uncharacterized protein n=1 Tax=Ephemerocybe angulata TaxID=980116 RepID=A0A8H6I303_9AGAR|nr:hypothetical protein DFP72DRAFT_1167833 [Tulosesus angulatus]